MDVVRNVQIADRIAQTLPLVADRLQQLTADMDSRAGLSPVQIQLLDYVYRNGASSIGTLRRALRRAQSSISELTDRLNEKGYVERSAGQDRRKALVGLTSRGRNWMLARQSHQREGVLKLLTALDPEARERLLQHLVGVLWITDRMNQPLPEFSKN
jgi:DNA-binding MarR family transcriptional regulator